MNSLINQGYGKNYPGNRNLFKFLMSDNNKDINDSYKMLKVIGIGAFGVVFTAINKKTKKRVAIKKVIKLLVYLSNLLNRFGKYSKTIFHMPRKSSEKSSY